MREPHLAVVRAESAGLPHPANHDLERIVLGEALLSAEARAEVESVVRAGDFDHPHHATIYEALCALAARGDAIDVVTLAHELETRGRLNTVGGHAYLGSLPDLAITTAHVAEHVRLLVDLAARRAVARAAHEIEVRACDPTVRVAQLFERATTAIFAATARGGGASASGPVTVEKAIEESLRALEQRATEAGEARYVGTGFPAIDAKLSGGGFRAGRLYVLAARPGIGKTALAANLARRAAGAGRVVLFLSLEMPRADLADRLLCAEARVDGRKYESHALSQAELDRIVGAAESVYRLPLLIDDTPDQTLAQVRVRTMRQVRRTGVGLLIIDYLQLVRVPGAESREREVGEVSRTLKAMAKEFGVPILAIAAMNRDAEKRTGDKRPQLSDLRDSGSIESDADLVAFLYRDELVTKNSADRGIAEFIIRKQRHGPVGTVRLRYDAPCLRFEPLAEGRDDTSDGEAHDE